MKKKIKRIKDIVLRNFKNLFEYEKEEENYYKPVRVNSTWSNNYFEYQSNSDKNKNTISWKIKLRSCIQKENKKATINPINKKDNKCFQYTVKVEFNYAQIK